MGEVGVLSFLKIKEFFFCCFLRKGKKKKRFVVQSYLEKKINKVIGCFLEKKKVNFVTKFFQKGKKIIFITRTSLEPMTLGLFPPNDWVITHD